MYDIVSIVESASQALAGQFQLVISVYTLRERGTDDRDGNIDDMPISGLNHFNLKICHTELDAVRDFYVRVLGLAVGARPAFDSFGYWLYAGDAPVVHLVATDSATAPTSTGTDVIDHLAFQCTDLKGTKARLQEAGVMFETRRVPGTTQHQLFFSDPAGVQVELIFEDLRAAVPGA